MGKVNIKWSPEFAYAIGLLATDGNLFGSQRHISLVSKDREQIENFKKCFGIDNAIGLNRSGAGNYHFRVQFGDMRFYNFLLSIGITPQKSKTIGTLDIPKKYFFDFLRGSFDGDGSFHSYWDPRWRSSFMFYTIFASASKAHVDWLRDVLWDRLKINGHITHAQFDSIYQLKYAKAESLKLLAKMYYNKGVVCLSRKHRKIEQVLKTIGKQL